MADSEYRTFSIRLPVELVIGVDVVLEKEGYTPTEYIRGLIRDDLRLRGLIEPVKPTTMEVAS